MVYFMIFNLFGRSKKNLKKNELEKSDLKKMDKNFVQINTVDPFEQTNLDYTASKHGRYLKNTKIVDLKNKNLSKLALIGHVPNYKKSILNSDKFAKLSNPLNKVNFQGAVVKSIFSRKKAQNFYMSQKERETYLINQQKKVNDQIKDYKVLGQKFNLDLDQNNDQQSQLLWQKIQSLEKKLMDVVNYSYKKDEKKQKENEKIITVEDFWKKYDQKRVTVNSQFSEAKQKTNVQPQRLNRLIDNSAILAKKSSLSVIAKTFRKFARPNFNRNKEEHRESALYLLIKQLPWGKTVDFQGTLGLILAIVFFSGLSFFLSQQFFHNLPVDFASELIRPNQTLSFQGRLTSMTRTPVIDTRSMRFQFFNHDGGLVPPPSGGNQIWDSNFCVVTPDRDGVFNVIFGGGQGLGSDDENCGASLDNVFDHYSTIYLQITIEGEILFPRQLIKSVPYALNSDTLRGFPPSLSATANTIPVLNDAGNMLLNTTASAIINQGGDLILQSLAQDGNIYFLPGGNGLVSIESSVLISQNLGVAGDLQATGSAIIGQNLVVNGDATVSGDLVAAGDVKIDKTLTFKANLPASVGICQASIAGKIYFNGETSSYFFCNGLIWIEVTSGAPNLYVLLAGRNDGQTLIGSDNGIGGLSLKGNSDGTGVISLNPDGGLVAVGIDLSVGQDLVVGRNTSISQNLTVGGEATIAGQLTVDSQADFGSDVSINQDLAIGRNATISGELTIAGNTTIANTLNFSPLSNLAYLNLLNNSALRVQTSLTDSSDLLSVLTLLNNGNLGLGTTSPVQKLTIDYGHLRFNYIDGPLTALTASEQVGSNVTKISSPIALTASVLTRMGNLSLGNYQYAVTFMTLDAIETSLGATASATVIDNSRVVQLSDIPLSTHQAVIKRKIYRTEANGSEFKLLTTINDNITTSFLDDLADISLTSLAPLANNTGKYQYYVSFMTDGGETNASPLSNVLTLANNQAQVGLINIPLSTDSRVVARRIYRNQSNYDQFYLLTTISDNTTTTFLDTVNDDSLKSVAITVPKTNSTAGSIFGEANLALQIGNDGMVVAKEDLIAEKRIEVSHSDNQGLKVPVSYGLPQAKLGQKIGDLVYDSVGKSLYVYDGANFAVMGGENSNYDFGSSGNAHCSNGICQLTLVPEFTSAVFSADGTNNQGAYTATYEVVEHNSNYYFFNYYKFTSAQTTLQDYDLIVNVKLPTDFGEFEGVGLTIDYLTNSSNSNNSALDVFVYKDTINPSTVFVSSLNNVTNNIWASNKIAGGQISLTKSQLDTLSFEGNSTLVIKLKAKAQNSYLTKISDINLFYGSVSIND